jgi:hypothetical protein
MAQPKERTMKTFLGVMLITALFLLHTAGREAFAATEEKAVSSENTASSTEAAKPEKTKDQSKPELKKAEPTPAATPQSKFTSWEADVWAPIIRLAAIVFILGALIWFLDLPSVMRAEAWSERTIMAFAIVFTYCAAALMGANDIVTVLKDVALVVIGFYFGASKGSREEQAPPRKEQSPSPQPVSPQPARAQSPSSGSMPGSQNI